MFEFITIFFQMIDVFWWWLVPKENRPAAKAFFIFNIVVFTMFYSMFYELVPGVIYTIITSIVILTVAFLPDKFVKKTHTISQGDPK